MRFIGSFFSVLVVPTLLIIFTPWLQSINFSDMKSSPPDFVVKIFEGLIYSIQVPVTAIVLFLVAVAWTFKKLYRPPPSLPVTPAFGSVTPDQVIELAALADQADIRVVQTDEGPIGTRSVLVDGITPEVRQMLRIVALANLEPVPRHSFAKLYNNDFVTMLDTFGRALATGYLEDDGVNFRLSGKGIHWAADAKRRGLGIKKPPIRGPEYQ